MSIKKHRERLKKLMDNCVDDIVDSTVETLIDNTPINRYTGGQFVYSFVVEESPKTYPRNMFPTGDVTKGGLMSDAEAAPIRSSVKPVLKAEAMAIMKKTGKVAINNKAKHANFVEYLGWMDFGGRTEPYFPVARTKESVGFKVKTILSETKHRTFNK